MFASDDFDFIYQCLSGDSFISVSANKPAQKINSSYEATENVACEGVADGIGKVASKVAGIAIVSFLCVVAVQAPP